MVNEKLAPEIRFDGFSEPWEQRKYIDVAPLQRGFDLPHSAMSEGIYPVVMSNGILYHHNKYMAKGPGVATGRSGTIGKVHYVECDYWPHNTALWVTNFMGNHPKFIYYLLTKLDLLRFGTGSGVPTLNRNDVHDTTCYIPTEKHEQMLISDLLRNLDDTIALKRQQYEQTVNIKRSMLEKMFPKKGADVPEIRFDGFTGAWEEKKIVEVCSISTGKSNTQDRIDEGIYPFYVRSSIIERSKRFLFDEEAVLTVGDGVGTGKVFHYVNGKYDLHQRVYRMFDFDSKVVGKYFYYYFSKHFYERVMSMTAKTSVDSVRLDMISDMDFIHPSKREQEMIVDFLDNLDTLIITQQDEFEKLQNIKKACLSKMFV